MIICFYVFGTPRGKGRPRFAKSGKFVKVYTDEKTEWYENQVKLCFESQCGKEGLYIPDGKPINAILNINFHIPKSYSKKKRDACVAGDLFPTKKPDIDNVSKIILDSLNGLAYKDDSAVISLSAIKQYVDDDISEGVNVTLIWDESNENKKKA